MKGASFDVLLGADADMDRCVIDGDSIPTTTRCPGRAIFGLINYGSDVTLKHVDKTYLEPFTCVLPVCNFLPGMVGRFFATGALMRLVELHPLEKQPFHFHVNVHQH